MATYKGKKVTLNKPTYIRKRQVGYGKAQQQVYVKNPKTGKVKRVTFGSATMKNRRNNPARRKSFRARMKCSTPGPKTKARYWACKTW